MSAHHSCRLAEDYLLERKLKVRKIEISAMEAHSHLRKISIKIEKLKCKILNSKFKKLKCKLPLMELAESPTKRLNKSNFTVTGRISNETKCKLNHSQRNMFIYTQIY